MAQQCVRCPRCGASYPPGVHSCGNCDAPLVAPAPIPPSGAPVAWGQRLAPPPESRLSTGVMLAVVEIALTICALVIGAVLVFGVPISPTRTPTPLPSNLGISETAFVSIQQGMTLADVEWIIGRPGRLTAQAQGVDTWQWQDPRTFYTMEIVFTNERVSMKSRAGLSKGPSR